MTVTRLRQELPNDEWIHWCVYQGRVAQRRELEAARMKNVKSRAQAKGRPR